MMERFLKLKTEYDTESLLALSRDTRLYSLENILGCDSRVYSEIRYSIEVCGFDRPFAKVQVLVNDEQQASYTEGNEVRFSEREGRIFEDTLGFVRFTLLLEYEDGSTEQWFSDFATVMVQEQDFNRVVDHMLQYVYDNQADFLYRSMATTGSRKEAGDTRTGLGLGLSGEVNETFRNDFRSLAVMMEEIANIYEENFGFFKSNSRYRLTQTEVVDRTEKLQYVGSRTIQYMVQHPEYLREAPRGILYGRQHYLPVKTLMPKNSITYDIYENRVVVNFLRYIYMEAEQIGFRVDEFLRLTNFPEKSEGGYIVSSYLIYMNAIRALTEIQGTIRSIRDRFEMLYQMYQQALNVTPEEITRLPELTQIFYSVPQYNQIFVCILQWYAKGGYDFAHEKMMMNFFNSSTIYEYYVLTKLIRTIQNGGFTLEGAEYVDYPLSSGAAFNSKECNNTFTFRHAENPEARLTLYYEPIIYDHDSSQINGIRLYRNNTFSLSSDGETAWKGKYYAPDYLLKYELRGKEYYLICDAKLCSRRVVETKHLQSLAYKYLFSISSLTDDAAILGLCIIYGKCPGNARMDTLYNRQIRKIRPAADMLPLNEEMGEKDQSKMLAEWLKGIVTGTE